MRDIPLRRLLLPLALVLVSGLAFGLALQLRWASKRSAPGHLEAPGPTAAMRFAKASAAGAAGAAALWLACFAFARRSRPHGAAATVAWRTAGPFVVGLPWPALHLAGALFDPVGDFLGIVFVVGEALAIAGSVSELRRAGLSATAALGRSLVVVWRAAPEVLRLDAPLLAIVAFYLALWLPVSARATENPRKLAAYVNDEPMITQQLVGMTLPPYGNPANGMRHSGDDLPEEWRGIFYYGVYYGGAYPGLALLAWLPLRLLGFPDFPTAPVLLRLLSLASGLVSLLVLYNLCRRVSGRIAAAAATLLLLTQPYFSYYSSIIHPDTLQLAFALLGLRAAIRHAESGSRESLLGLGILSGLVQGTKMGGPWMIPMAVLAVAWGGARARALSTRAWVLSAPFVRSLLVLGASAFAAFALSTPYAFLDGFYLHRWQAAWKNYQTGTFGSAPAAEWGSLFWAYEGSVYAVLELAGIGWGLLACLRRERRPELVLPFVLCASVVGWTLAVVRVWTCLGYLLPALACSAFLACELVARVARTAASRAWILRLAAGAAAVSLVFAILPRRAACALSMAAHLHCLERYTVVQVGAWAQAHLPRDSRIVADDLSYFDPSFRGARVLCGLLTDAQLAQLRPDYFTINSGLYDDAKYMELRKTQAYERGQEGPFSVLLYQELLDRGGLPECELLAAFSPTLRPSGGTVELDMGLVVSYVRMATGLDDRVLGPTIRLYRYHPPLAPEPESPQPEGAR